MEINQLYQLILLLVLSGMILGVGVLTLGKFGTTTGITSNASEVLNDTIQALNPIASDWMPLIVTVAVLAIILTLVVRSFSVGGR